MVHDRDVHRLFLQSMLSRGAVPDKLARKIWQKSIEAVNGQSPLYTSLLLRLTPTSAVGNSNIPLSDSNDAWQLFLNSINTSLDKLEFAFRPTRDQRTGQTVYSIVRILAFLLPSIGLSVCLGQLER